MSWQRYIARLRRRQARRPQLEESILGGRLARYALYRLRYVGFARLIALVVHLVELVFLTRAFSSSSLVFALVLQNGAALIGGFWWGALEELRHPLRSMRPDSIAAQLIGRWLGRARVLAIVAAVLALAGLIAVGPAPLIAAYATVVVGRLVADLILRTYYSGVYARRRVYRPLGVIVAVELAGLVAVVALWPVIGPWAFPIGFAVGIAASRTALYVYTRRAYRQIRQVEPHRGRVAPEATWAIAAPGLAGIASRAGSLVVMALLFAGPRDVVLLAHAIAPILSTAAGWPFVFYLDVVRLERTPAARLAERFERALLAIGAAVAAVLIGVALIALAVMFGSSALVAGLALAPVVIAQCALAAIQLARFARRHYRSVALGSIGLAAGLAAGLASMEWAPLSPMLATSSGAGLALVFAIAVTLAVRRPAPELPATGAVESGLVWLAALREVDGAVLTGEIGLADRRPATRERALESVAAALGDRGAVYPASPDRLRWFAAGAGSPIDPRALQLELSGLLERCDEPTAHPSAAAAIAVVFPAPRALPDELAATAKEIDGAVIAEVGGDCSGLAALDPDVRAAIWRAAVSAATGRKRKKSAYDVSCFAPGGVIEVIFAVPRSAPARQRVALRERVEAASAAATADSRNMRSAL